MQLKIWDGIKEVFNERRGKVKNEYLKKGLIYK